MFILKLLFAPLLLAASAAGAQQLAYQMTLIPRLDYPNGINDLGQIAANGFNASGDIQAAVWTPGATPSLRFLGTPPDFSGDINNAGQVTGQHQFAPGEWRAAIFSNGTVQDLGAPGPSAGYAINASGQVAGRLQRRPQRRLRPQRCRPGGRRFTGGRRRGSAEWLARLRVQRRRNA
jgi:hypothetical protein